MMTPAEIQELVGEHWPVAKRSSTALLLVLDLDGYPQKVLLETAAERGRPGLVVVAEVG